MSKSRYLTNWWRTWGGRQNSQTRCQCLDLQHQPRELAAQLLVRDLRAMSVIRSSGIMPWYECGDRASSDTVAGSSCRIAATGIDYVLEDLCKRGKEEDVPVLFENGYAIWQNRKGRQYRRCPCSNALHSTKGFWKFSIKSVCDEHSQFLVVFCRSWRHCAGFVSVPLRLSWIWRFSQLHGGTRTVRVLVETYVLLMWQERNSSSISFGGWHRVLAILAFNGINIWPLFRK